MKKTFKKYTVLAVIMAFVLVAGAFLFIVPAKASSTEVQGFYDDFNSSEFSAEWKNNGATSYTPYNALRFNGGYYWEGAAVVSQKIFDEKNDLTISVDLRSESLGSWFAVAFGGLDTGSAFYGYDSAIIISIADVTLYETVGGGGLTRVEAQSYETTVFNDSTSNVLRMVFDLTYNEETGMYGVEFNVYKVPFAEYDYTDKTADFGESVFECSFTNVNISLDYLGFNCMNHVVDLLKVDITDDEGEVFSDDFATPSITYSDEAVGDKKWHVCMSYGKDNLYIAPIGSAKFSDDAFMTYTENVFRVSDYIDKIFGVSVEVKISDATDGSGVAFGFGLKEDSASLDKVNAIGLRKNVSGKYDFCLLRKGALIEKQGSVSLDNDTKYVLKLSVYADNRVEFSVNGETAVFSDVDYNGLIGIGTVGTGASFEIDNFDYRYNTYVYSDAADMSVNFKGTKEDEEGYLSYYINKKEWYLGSNVKFPERYNSNRSSLIFNNCDGNSAFGPKAKYSEYMVQFDVKVTGGASDKSIASFGLAFGKTSFSSNILLTTAVGFTYNDVNKLHKDDADPIVQTVIQGYYGVTTEKGDTYAFIRENGEPVNMWDGRTYNICFIVRNRSVEVYFKEESQPIEQLAVCRAKYTDVNTYGYPSVFGTNGVSFELMNFKITNMGLS